MRGDEVQDELEQALHARLSEHAGDQLDVLLCGRSQWRYSAGSAAWSAASVETHGRLGDACAGLLDLVHVL